jgi:hypothetical protein
LKRYETSPKREMNPPSVAQTMLKLIKERVGMAAEASRQTWHNPTGKFLRYTPDAADIMS